MFSSNKILTFENLSKINSISSNTKVLCGGVFDLFHIGHLKFLERAKDLGEILIVHVD